MKKKKLKSIRIKSFTPDYHQPITEKFQLIKNFVCFLSFLLFQGAREVREEVGHKTIWQMA